MQELNMVDLIENNPITKISNTYQCKLLQKIKIYATDHNTLFFLEALFPTITMKYNLIYDTPNELSTIEYRYNFMPHELNKTNLFHPIKDMDKHFIYKTN